MKSRLNILLFFIGVLVLPIMAYGIYYVSKDRVSNLPVYGNPVMTNAKGKIDHTVGSFVLTNQYGRVVTSNDWNKKIVVANFFFTRCPSICPKMTLQLKRINEAYNNDERIRFASFTVDPLNDSVTNLKNYIEKFKIDDRHWEFLTGDKKDIYRLARNGFILVATEGDGGPTDFIHSDKLVLIDTKQRIRGYYDGTSDAETQQLIKDIKKLQHEEF